MSKYIIELDENVKKVVAISLEDAIMWTDEMEVDDLEELNSDYINEHFGDLQDEAYKRGLEEGKKATWGLVADASSAEYQRGLDDAWEAARKIVCDDELDWNTLLHIFNRGNFDGIFGDFSPSEAIDKLKSYKEKQKADGEIKVGDEVIYNEHRFIVFTTETEEHYASLFDVNGNHASASQSKCKKTGRHFDIDKILEAMKE